MQSTNSNDFFANAPENYEVPKSESRYMKFKEPGQYRFRILERPIFGWVGWQNEDGKDKPHRFPMNEKPTDLTPFRNSRLDHFWVMPVWNYATNRVEVLEVTQKTIQEAIEGYARNPDWGTPLGYNLTVIREGTTLNDTKYQVMPAPHKSLDPAIGAEWDKVKGEGFDITELYRDGDPFAPSGAPQAPQAAAAPQTEPETVPAPQTAPEATAAPQTAPEHTEEPAIGPEDVQFPSQQ